MSARASLVAAAVVSATVVLAGCVDPEPSPDAAGTTTPSEAPTPTTTIPVPTPAVLDITIENFDYSHLSVPAATSVNVINRDDVVHTVTSDQPGLFDVEVQPRSEQIFMAPADSGTYRYHCEHHPSMRGELVVH